MLSPLLQKELETSLKVLQLGDLLLYPTDTVWGLGCDAQNPEAVERIYQLKQRPDSKALIILVESQERLHQHVENVPESVLPLLQETDRPTTIVYPKAKNLAPNLIASNGSIAIRIVQQAFCQSLIQAFNGPIVSTSANISGEPTAQTFSEISNEIVQGVNFHPNPSYFTDKKEAQSSRILKIEEDGSLSVIR